MSDTLVAVVAAALFLGGGALVLLSLSPVGRVLAERLRGRRAPAPRAVDGDDEVAELRRELEELRKVASHTAQLAERVEFLERALGQREAERHA